MSCHHGDVNTHGCHDTNNLISPRSDTNATHAIGAHPFAPPGGGLAANLPPGGTQKLLFDPSRFSVAGGGGGGGAHAERCPVRR